MSVKNIICMEGISSLPLYSETNQFDFSKIAPMPQELDVEHSLSVEIYIMYHITRRCSMSWRELPEDKLSLVTADPGYLFSRALKIEKGKWKPTRDSYDNRGRVYVQNIRCFGFPSWYGWRKAHWGTKWNATGTAVSGADEVSFSTVDNPPLPVVASLSAMYPGSEIEFIWLAEDFDIEGSGRAIFRAGQAVEGGPFASWRDAYPYFAERSGRLQADWKSSPEEISTQRLVIRINRDQKDAFKSLCEKAHMPATAAIIRFAERAVEEGELPFDPDEAYAARQWKVAAAKRDGHFSLRISFDMREAFSGVCQSYKITVSSAVALYMDKCLGEGKIL